MSIEVWKKEIEEIKSVYSQVSSQAAKSALGDAVHKLKKQINDEENRIKSNLDVRIIDGKVYSIPKSFNWSDFDKYTLYIVGDVLYVIDARGKLDKDNSYHWWHYAWIPNGNKFTKLLVRTLGGDNYGDRYFAETSHYKHPADSYSYQNRHLYPDNQTYKIHIEYILKKVGVYDKIFKSK